VAKALRFWNPVEETWEDFREDADKETEKNAEEDTEKESGVKMQESA
jgi:hypothetical protein